MKQVIFLVYAVLIICNISGTARAGDLTLDIHGVSKHFNTEGYFTRNKEGKIYTQSYNEKNYGLGITKTWGYQGIMAGAYKNSFGRLSTYAAYTIQTPQVFNLSLGLEIGVVNGYGPALSPMLAPKLQVQLTEGLVLKVRYLPEIQAITPAVASISLSVKLI